jgi:hypothetical protein
MEKSIDFVAKHGQKLSEKLANNDKHSSSRLIIQNCTELFKKQEQFKIHSTAIKMAGFKWYLLAEHIEQGFLSLAVIAKPTWQKFSGNYELEVQ